VFTDAVNASPVPTQCTTMHVEVFSHAMGTWAAVNTCIHTYRAPGCALHITLNVREIVPMVARRHLRHTTVRAARCRYD
jgi:hypothetical protein